MNRIKLLLFTVQRIIYQYLLLKAKPNRIDVRLYCSFCKKHVCTFYDSKKDEVSNAWNCKPIKGRINKPYPYGIIVNKCCGKIGKPIVRQVKVNKK